MGYYFYGKNYTWNDNVLTDKEHTEATLTRFADNVIDGAKANLKTFSDLAHSLESIVEKRELGFSLKFIGNHYAAFHDKGVEGKESSARMRPNRFLGDDSPQDNFRFGTGSFTGKTGQGGAFDIAMQRWIRFKGLKLRDIGTKDKDGNIIRKGTGKFIKGGIKSLSYLIRRDKYLKGIRPSLFFTDPFNTYFFDLVDELEQSYASDIEQHIDENFETE